MVVLVTAITKEKNNEEEDHEVSREEEEERAGRVNVNDLYDLYGKAFSLYLRSPSIFFSIFMVSEIKL